MERTSLQKLTELLKRLHQHAVAEQWDQWQAVAVDVEKRIRSVDAPHSSDFSGRISEELLEDVERVRVLLETKREETANELKQLRKNRQVLSRYRKTSSSKRKRTRIGLTC